MRTHDDTADDEVIPFLEYAENHLNEWLAFAALDEKRFSASIRWLIGSKNSTLRQTTEDTPKIPIDQRSFDLMWKLPSGQWSRDIKTPGVFQQGHRIGRLKLRVKRTSKQ